MMEKIVKSDNLQLWTESIGNKQDIPCLLISGAGAPAKFWSDNFCRQLVEADYFVIRYDHRDQGLSDAVDWDTNPYTVKDLADDAIQILNAYEIKKAHVVGHSMGGRIAQLLAIYYADRLFSFTSMSVATAGKIGLPPKEVMDILLENKPIQDFAKDLPSFMRSWKILNGDYEVDEEMAKQYTQDFYIRSKHPVGVAWNHIRCQEDFNDLRKQLKNNTVPGLFIHGEKDPLIPVQGAKDTAQATANSKLIIIPGMGHMFFNRKLESQIANFLLAHFKKIH